MTTSTCSKKDPSGRETQLNGGSSAETRTIFGLADHSLMSRWRDRRDRGRPREASLDFCSFGKPDVMFEGDVISRIKVKHPHIYAYAYSLHIHIHVCRHLFTLRIVNTQIHIICD